MVQAAQRRGIPTAIHEQNAFPGVTNKILAKHASVVLAAMPDAVSRLGAPEKTVVVGNPVRAEMFRADRAAARRALGVQPGQVVIVSFGGSLGAQVLNERVADLARVGAGKPEFPPYPCHRQHRKGRLCGPERKAGDCARCAL